MRALLDVNVWIALLDDAHQFSERANAFIAKRGVQIATCPSVENGVVRVPSSPHYSRRSALGIAQVRQRLREACGELDQAFWPDDVSLRDDDLFNSFDQALSFTSVLGASPKHLVLL